MIRELVSLLGNTPSALINFRAQYQARGPRIQPAGVEAVLLPPSSGFKLLPTAPALGVAFGHPPNSRRSGRNRYLWVINDAGVPFIQEIPIAALNGREPKHTNLTGGGPAYMGGELWFETDTRIFVSGGSGRYPPYGAQQLEDAVGVFAAYQYTVTSLGWNPESGEAKRRLE